ncbi:MAG: hypothetical protein KIT74_00875 [Fimbriimonadales bacterium]|nr:hypothetical protein [Fimbriimonadales bacterium]
MNEQQFFKLIGRELFPDPAKALRPVSMPAWEPEVGPYHKVQYVVELVGPSLIPAVQAKALLEPKTRAGLGDPEIYVMAPGAKRWKSLWTGDDSMNYDSIAFAWDLVGKRGTLSNANAKELWTRCDKLGAPWTRRAIAMPPPDEVDQAASRLRAIQESFDVGVDVTVQKEFGSLPTMTAVEEAYAIGFRFGDSGLLEWKSQGWPAPLLWVYPISDDSALSLEDQRIEGIAIGYSLPCSPSPVDVLERLFESSDAIGKATHSSVYDTDGNPLTETARNAMRDSVRLGAKTLTDLGLRPGSAEALRLFEE